MFKQAHTCNYLIICVTEIIGCLQRIHACSKVNNLRINTVGFICSVFPIRKVKQLRWRSLQSKRLSPLKSWVRFLLRKYDQRSAESRGLSPVAPVSSNRES